LICPIFIVASLLPIFFLGENAYKVAIMVSQYAFPAECRGLEMIYIEMCKSVSIQGTTGRYFNSTKSSRVFYPDTNQPKLFGTKHGLFIIRKEPQTQQESNMRNGQSGGG
jgi:hypothetical protein